MIEVIIHDYLVDKLDVPVLMEIPVNPASAFIVLEKVGSGLENHIRSASIAVQSYGESLLDAVQLNESVKTAMLDLDGLDEICSVRLNTDYNFTDPSAKRYRYQAVFDITHY